MQANAVMGIADVSDRLGRTEVAWKRALEALRLCRECGDRQLTLFGLALLARLEVGAGRADRAGRLWGAIEAEESRGPVGYWENARDEIASFQAWKILQTSPPPGQTQPTNLRRQLFLTWSEPGGRR